MLPFLPRRGWGRFSMTRLFNRTTEKEKRRALRKDMPEPEKRIWARLRAKQIYGHKFRRQYSIGNFIVDFYCPEKKLAIEIDGDSHFTQKMRPYDAVRQKYIESKGIHVVRFTNQDITENVEGVLVHIAESLKHG
jgi:very-short-patch-repair endonuclease